jgi:hypothetical protein
MDVSALSGAKVKLIKPDRTENQESGGENVVTLSALSLKLDGGAPLPHPPEKRKKEKERKKKGKFV